MNQEAGSDFQKFKNLFRIMTRLDHPTQHKKYLYIVDRWFFDGKISPYTLHASACTPYMHSLTKNCDFF